MRERKYVKFNVNMYSDTKFKIIDRRPERDLIHYIWTRMVILAGKCNGEGELYMSRTIPYTVETLAIEFNRGNHEVKLALDLLIELEMVELTEEQLYKVKNFAKHQNIKEKVKETVLKNNQIQEAKETEVLKSQSLIEVISNNAVNEDISKEEKSFEKETNIKIEESDLDTLQDNSTRVLKVKNNKRNYKKKKTDDIITFDFEENEYNEINGFHEGEISLDKGEHVIMKIPMFSEG